MFACVHSFYFLSFSSYSLYHALRVLSTTFFLNRHFFKFTVSIVNVRLYFNSMFPPTCQPVNQSLQRHLRFLQWLVVNAYDISNPVSIRAFCFRSSLYQPITFFFFLCRCPLFLPLSLGVRRGLRPPAYVRRCLYCLRFNLFPFDIFIVSYSIFFVKDFFYFFYFIFLVLDCLYYIIFDFLCQGLFLFNVKKFRNAGTFFIYNMRARIP